MESPASAARAVILAACLVWAPVAAAQTPLAGAAPAPQPDETSSPALPPLPPLPPPTPDDGASVPVPRDAVPRVDSVPAGGAHDADAPGDASAASATATAPPNPWAAQPLVGELQFGVGTPLGLAGVAVDYSPLPILGLDLGIGLGLGGVQYAFATRLRPIRAGRRTHVGVYLSGGVSMGAFNTEYAGPDVAVDGSQGDSENPVPHYHWDAAYWMNLEAGVEIRLATRLSLRPFAGAAFLLNPSAGTAVSGQRGEMPAQVDRWWPYLGFAIGYVASPGW